MRTLRHRQIADARVRREIDRVSSDVVRPRVADGLSKVSVASRKERLRLVWQRSAKTGELQGRWQFAGQTRARRRRNRMPRATIASVTFRTEVQRW
jgi:hypothetical protein